jgi:hypothetical protein
MRSPRWWAIWLETAEYAKKRGQRLNDHLRSKAIQVFLVFRVGSFVTDGSRIRLISRDSLC